jgi:peptidoglycan/LPS O-acetylase OafA/YrhL
MTLKDKYFPHVDGLRALAVLAVVLFHLDIPYLTAGYMGVDVFFVISGFLITGHVIRARESNNFSLIHFYGRRMRRLLPALFVVLCLTLASSIFILAPIYLEELAEQSLSAMFAVSNIFFWINSGYFETDSSLKPLLHTWSLGVEEQFYLIWPLLILLLWKHKHWMVPIISLVSLLVCEWFLRKDSSGAFFLMPFRVVEFGVGAWVYILLHKSHPMLNKQALSVVGLISIVGAFFYYSKLTLFPGISALVVCFGTAFVIYAGQHTLVGKFLSIRPALWIGAISYSLYLCHWPVIVLTRHLQGPNDSILDILFDVVLFTVASIALFYMVEKPFRSKKLTGQFRVSTQALAIFLFTCMTLIGAMSAFIFKVQGQIIGEATLLTKMDYEKGMSDRLKLLQVTCSTRSWETCYDPNSNAYNVMVIGNSHALDGFNIISTAYPNKHVYMKALPGGCAPMVPDDEILMAPSHPSRQECINFNKALLTYDGLKDANAIVINARIGVYRGEHILKTVKLIRSIINSEVKVIVLGGYIETNKSMFDLINENIDPRVHQEYILSVAKDEDMLRRNAGPLDYIYISKKELVCEGNEVSSCPIYFGNEPFAFDGNHLSLSAAKTMGENLAKRYPMLLD